MASKKTTLPTGGIYHSMSAALAKPNRKAAGPYLYALYLIDIEQGIVVDRFGFDIPPQVSRLDEDAAVTATAAQDGGYWSDERGQYFKMLSVSGHFGFRPTPKTRSRDPFSSVRGSVDQLGDQVTAIQGRPITNLIPEGEVSGDTRYRKLHNLVRTYFDFKKSRALAGRYVLVWANWKMGEVYISQVVRFTRDRSTPRGKFITSYNFTLRLLEPLLLEPPRDFLKALNRADGERNLFLDKVKKSVQILETSSRLIRQAAQASIDYGFDIFDTVVRPIDSVVESLNDTADIALSSVQQTIDFAAQVARIPLGSLKGAHRSLLQAVEIARAEEGFNQVAYDYLRADRSIAEVYSNLSQMIGLGGLNNARNQVAKQYKTWDGDAALDSEAIPAGEMKRGDGGSNTSLGGGSAPSSYRTVRLPGRVTPQGFAAEYLGSAGRWKEIVLLNRLSPPYFSPQGDGKTILRPGDPVKLPSPPDDTSGDSQVYSDSESVLDEDEFLFGQDLKVDLETRDLVIDANGDFELVNGLDNLKQAMYIKIWTRPGDLKAHPWFGFSPSIGEGVSVDKLSENYFQVRSTLLSDVRIDDIASLLVEAHGDILKVSARLIPITRSSVIPLIFETPA